MMKNFYRLLRYDHSTVRQCNFVMPIQENQYIPIVKISTEFPRMHKIFIQSLEQGFEILFKCISYSKRKLCRIVKIPYF
jgi:hypothetical protein